MNRLQSLTADERFCVTLNRSEAIDPEKVIRTIAYAHPVYTQAGVAAQARHEEVSGPRRTHFCGAYWGWGFHEDGVVSAIRVAERLGAPRGVTHSAVYEGTVRHRRFAVRRHELNHRLSMAYLDLDELPRLAGGRLLRRRPGLVRFRRRDYLGDPAVPLADAVRALVAERTGAAPDGPIRLLTNLRTLGRCFNPVSFYYCFDRDEHLRVRRRRGDQHAVGRAPRLRADRRRPRPARRAREGDARVAVHGHGAALRGLGHRAGPDAVGAHRDQPGGRPRVRRHAAAAPPAVPRRRWARCACCR